MPNHNMIKITFIDDTIRYYSSQNEIIYDTPENRNLYKSADLSNTQITILNTMCFYKCKQLEHVIFPTTLKSLKSSVFAYCHSLKKCDLSNTQTEYIEQQCFYECKKLEHVKFPTTLKTIKWEVFAYCHSLKKCDLSNTQIERIGSGCFYGCISLPNMVIPSTLNIMKWSAFTNCDKMGKIYFEGEYKEGFDLSSLNAVKRINRSNKTHIYYKFKNKKSWSNINKKPFKNIRFLLYPNDQLIIILPLVGSGMILMFILYKLINKILKKNKSLVFTVLFESCVNAIVFYILFAFIELKFMNKITTGQILKYLKNHDDIFINDLLGIDKKSIPSIIKPTIKKYIFDNFKDVKKFKNKDMSGGIDDYIKETDAQLKITMSNNLKSSIIVISPLVGITVLLLVYYIVNNKFNKTKIKVAWGHMFITIFFIGIAITLYEVFVIFYYLNKTKYTNPYISYYLWARGTRGTQQIEGNIGNRGNKVYLNKGIIEEVYKDTKSIDKYCSKFNHKKGDSNKCVFNECVSNYMCDHKYVKMEGDEFADNTGDNLLPGICNRNKDSDNNCFAP